MILQTDRSFAAFVLDHMRLAVEDTANANEACTCARVEVILGVCVAQEKRLVEEEVDKSQREKKILPKTIEPIALSHEMPLSVEIVVDQETTTRLNGRADWALRYRKAHNDAALLVVEVKQQNDVSAAIPQCLAYMGKSLTLRFGKCWSNQTD